MPQPRRARQRRRGGSAAIQQLVQQADRREVTAGFGAAAAAAPRLVAAGNRFDGQIPGNTNPPVTQDAPAYFAAASILHLEDGYSYAGRSLGALLRGDRGAATHLAYYGELRAAMSLLASHGILNLNFVVFSLGSGTQLLRSQPGSGTHVLAWQLLDEWTTRTEALDLLSDALRPFNVPMRDWLKAAGIPELAASAQATAQHWLRVWSLDLKRMQADRRARNRFSYNPTRLIARPDFATEPFVAQTWRLLEPTPGNPFDLFDRHLLRAIVEQILDTTVDQATSVANSGGALGRLAPNASTALDAYVASAQQYAGSGGWKDFLRRVPPHDHDAAVVTFSASRDDHPWSLLSRALILLRVAAGAVRTHLTAAGIAGAPMETWANEVIQERSLIDVAIDNLDDLWVDIEVALDHLANCPPMDDYTQSMLRQLETSERVALWALAA